MAGDWIKMEVALPDKPEVWRMAGVLSIDADSVVGKLLRVWAWFDSHTEDGNAVGVSYPLLDRVAGVAGFAEAMALVGWLEQNGHVLTLPKFGRHNGKTAKNRALTNERVAKSRTKQRDCNDESNAGTVTGIVSKTVTREEKRREEKNSASNNVVGGPRPTVEAPPAFSGESDLQALNGKHIVPLATGWELPEPWGIDAEALGWKSGDVLREAEKFRQYWTAGRGAGTRRSVKGWRQTWSNWLEKAARDKR